MRNRNYINKKIWTYLVFIVLIFFSMNSGVYAQDPCGENWYQSHSERGIVFRAVATNGFKWVAVGDLGVFFYSTDGKNWTRKANLGTTHLLAMAYGQLSTGEKRFVIGGYKGKILTSDNGLTWTSRTSALDTGIWGMEFGKDGSGNDLFVAASNTGLATSPDGINWTKRSSVDDLKKPAYGNGYWIVPHNKGYLKSTDGTTWTNHALGATSELSAAFGGGTFVIGGSKGDLFYSTNNGSTWASVNINNNYKWAIIYVDDIFVAVGNTDYNVPDPYSLIMTSKNGITWTRQKGIGMTTLNDVASNGSLIVTVGISGLMGYSSCGPEVPAISVTSPDGGEILETTKTHNITWDSQGGITDVKIEYSSDNGGSYNVITASTSNTGTYPWLVPNVSVNPVSICLIRVSDAADDDPTDESNSNFTIVPEGTEIITVTSPDGGESLTIGNFKNITWTNSNIPGDVKIEISRNGIAGTYSTIVNPTPNDGLYKWAVSGATSSNCWIRISDIDDDPADESNYAFTIAAAPPPPPSAQTITIISPNGGETLAGGEVHMIQWSSSAKFSGVDIEYYNGSTWNPITTGTADDGSYSWTVPNISTSGAKLWIKGYDGSSNPTDFSDNTYTIGSGIVETITVTSPNGGETLDVGAVHNIQWSSSTSFSGIDIEYYDGSKWNVITTGTTDDGSYSWTVPNTLTTKAKLWIKGISNGLSPTDYSDTTFTIAEATPSSIKISRSSLNFGTEGSSITKSQEIGVSNSGGSTLNWTAEDNAEWLICSPTSGTGDQILTISVNPSGLSIGTHTGIISVTDPEAGNSPQNITVRLTVFASGSTGVPFGSFDTPLNGSTVSGSVPVTGWALDDIEVETVKIYRDATASEGNHLVYIGDATFVEDARSDIEETYPDLPLNYRAGWGYMLLSNFLPDEGNGTFVLKAVAIDKEGRETLLGSATVNCDNANAVAPFGAIDEPSQGGTVSGNNYVNWGWALTPQPNTIPVDGSTIKLFIDGTLVGNPAYNVYRVDIATLFPSYANSDGAIGYYHLDTTAFANGLHTIEWAAVDNAGNSGGIGSRYFKILNTSSDRKAASNNNVISFDNLPDYERRYENVEFIKGFSNLRLTSYNSRLVSKEIERIVLNLNPDNKKTNYTGYLRVGNKLRKLPIGSTLNNGKFYWSPGPGFIGEYDLVFVDKILMIRKEIKVIIVPKFGINDIDR